MRSLPGTLERTGVPNPILQLAPARPLLAVRLVVLIEVHGLVVVLGRRRLVEQAAPPLAEPRLAVRRAERHRLLARGDAASASGASSTPESSSTLLALLLLLDQARHRRVPAQRLGRAPRRLPAHAGDLGLEVVERRLAAGGPGAQRGGDAGDGAGGDVAQGRHARHLHALVRRVELRGQQARVHGRDDEVLERALRGQGEGAHQAGVAEGVLIVWVVVAVASGGAADAAGGPGEGEQRELPQLGGLGVVEGGQARRGGVRLVGAVAEDLEQGEVGGQLRRSGGEGLDLRCLEQLGEDKGARGGRRADDEVGGGAGRGC